MIASARVHALATSIVVFVACADTPEPAGVAVSNPFLAALEVKALPQYEGFGAGDSINVTVAIHNPTRVPVRVESPQECLITSVHVTLGPIDASEDVPLIGTGDVDCAARGATIVLPGDTLFVSHTLIGWRLDDTVESRWRDAPWPSTHSVHLSLAPLERTVNGTIRFRMSGYHYGFGRDCDPSDTPPDTIQIVINPLIVHTDMDGRRVQYEIHDTRPELNGISVCQPLISATVDRWTDSGWVLGGFRKWCLAHWSGSYELGPTGCMRGVLYLRYQPEGSYRLRLPTWRGELTSDLFELPAAFRSTGQ